MSGQRAIPGAAETALTNAVARSESLTRSKNLMARTSGGSARTRRHSSISRSVHQRGPRKYSVYLGGHYEVVLMQAHLLGMERDSRVAPSKTDIRMVAFGFCDFTNLLDKAKRLPEILEPEVPLDRRASSINCQSGACVLSSSACSRVRAVLHHGTEYRFC